MKRIAWIIGVLILLVFAAQPVSGQTIGKYVPIAAGSDADHALTEINAATDPAQKLALIDKFSTTLGQGDMAIVADDLYVNYYLAQKNYDKAFEYGDKLFALDPDNFANALNMVRAASEKGDTDKLMSYGEKVPGILQRFKAYAGPGRSRCNQLATAAKRDAGQQQGQYPLHRTSHVPWGLSGNEPSKTGRDLDALRATLPRFGLRRSCARRGGKRLSTGAERAENAGGGERTVGQGSKQYRNAAFPFRLLQREGRATG